MSRTQYRGHVNVTSVSLKNEAIATTWGNGGSLRATTATAQPVTVTLYKLLPFRMKPGWKHTRFSLRNKPLRATTDRWVYYPPTEGLGKSGLQHGMDMREQQPRARRGRRNLCQSALALFTSFREIAMQIGLHQVTASYDLAADWCGLSKNARLPPDSFAPHARRCRTLCPDTSCRVTTSARYSAERRCVVYVLLPVRFHNKIILKGELYIYVSDEIRK